MFRQIRIRTGFAMFCMVREQYAIIAAGSTSCDWGCCPNWDTSPQAMTVLDGEKVANNDLGNVLKIAV